MSLVTAVCRVDRLLPDSGTIGVTAIDKRPVAGKVRVRPLGLHADVQADRKHHGGEDQAVYAYADEDADYFAASLGREIPPGLFGENLRTTGVDVTGAVTGGGASARRWSSRSRSRGSRAAPSRGGWASTSGCGGSPRKGGRARTCGS